MLGPRALNRALLARQALLERQPMSTESAVEHLVGLQAQAPLAPYVGLWSRVDGFRPESLSAAIIERRAVRTSLMRSTIHLVSADDALWLRPTLQPALERGFRGSPFGQGLSDADLSAIADAGAESLDAQPLTSPELGRRLGERWPDVPPGSLSAIVGYLVPLAHVPPRGVWGESGPIARTTLTGWLGRPLAMDPAPETLVMRYLAAFGPASVADVQAWSGLTRLGAVVDRQRPNLLVLRDTRGRELFDLPGAPRPDPDTPAAVRFLPEYDNVLLGHRDRSRIIPVGRSIPLPPGNGATMGTILLDGMLGGTWRITRDAERATLTVKPFDAVGVAERRAVEDEGARLLAFACSDAQAIEIIVRSSTS